MKIPSLMLGVAAMAVYAQPQRPPAIASITVCSPSGAGGQGSCPSGSFDTHQIVLGPGGSGSVNKSALGVDPVPDEHSTVFAPGALGANQDYLFFLASTESHPGIGVAVLSGGSGPDKTGKWTLDYPKTDGYGSYASGFGQVFNAAGPLESCPPVADGNPAHQDPTFDLNYAAPGSVVKDPTAPPGSLLMVYEGANACIGSASGARPGTGSYISLAIATSLDFGKTWPTYRGTSTFNFVPLPETNHNQGPNAPLGATGANVCLGNDCTKTPPSSYGRYVVVTSQESITSLIAAGKTLDGTIGEQEISGFVDDVGGNPKPYLYATSGGGPRVARAQLNGGTALLTFQKWNGQAFASPGIGSPDTNVLPAGPFENCEGVTQLQYGSSISYVEDAQQYLLTFVCDSPGDPVLGPQSGAHRGGAWFWSTSYDLSDQTQWTAPREIPGTWGEFDTSGGCSDYKGFYPTFMSLGKNAGHLSLTGYVFYLWGCQQAGTPPPGRQFSARAFMITTAAKAVPQINSGGVVNNASYASGAAAPGEIAAIFGSNLTDGSSCLPPNCNAAFGTNGRLGTTMAGAEVTVNGTPVPIFYATPGQLGVQIPFELTANSAAVVVSVAGQKSPAENVNLAAVSPGIFTATADGKGAAAVTHVNGSAVTSQNPAQPNELVIFYATGLGQVAPAVATGTLPGGISNTVAAVTLSIGGITVVPDFAGLAGCCVGLNQINARIPLGVTPGNAVPVVLNIGGKSSNMATIAVQGSSSNASAKFYVALNGKDSWSGTLAAPNASNTDGPFASFERARAAVQSLNKAGLNQISVQFRAGTYFLPATESFTAADSGSASLPITYENYPGESPIISGGVRVRNWTNVTGNTWKTTLPASTQYFENLFYNDVRRLRPRVGGSLGTYLRIAATVYLNAPGPPAAAPDPNCPIYVNGSGWECFDRFQYNAVDPVVTTWKNFAPAAGNPCGQPAGNAALAGDIEILIFEKFQAAKLRVSCIDTAKHIVYLTGPTVINPAFFTALGFIPNHRYLIENVQDQLTQAGQWFLDRSANPWTLTYLANPGENPNSDTVVIPQIAQVLVASNLQYVTFQGLTFEHDNYTEPAAGDDPDLKLDVSAAVSFQNSQHITFESSTVAHTSGSGLDFVSCTSTQSPSWCVSTNVAAVTANNAVQNSAFFDIGSTAVRVGAHGTADDTDANIPQFTTVQNNVVEGYGRVFPGSYGVTQGNAHDNLYTHNDVYDGYRAAIGICFCSGFKPDSHDNVISFNHVYNLLQGIMNDDGSLYIQARNSQGASPPGNKILNNKVHDVSDASALDADGYGGDGIYIDTQTGLVDVENNLVYRVSGSPMNFAGAPQNPNEASTIKNNIFAFGRTDMLRTSNPYPDGAPASPIPIFTLTNNLFYFDRNGSSTPAFYVQGGCTYRGGFPNTAWEQWNSNLYWRTDGGFANDPQAFHTQPTVVSQFNLCFGEAAMAKWTFFTFANWQKTGEDVQSVVKDPGFKNPAYPADDFSLPKGSPGVGFIVFDPNQAGRSNPVINPPAVPATFPAKSFNPAVDY